MTTQTAVFAAGCFWGVEEVFARTPGVTATAVGYTGGLLDNPTYEDVCADTSGHAEAVQVEFDPEVVRFEELLRIFFENHDPTTLNRQGPDVGTQYRSAVFYQDEDQRRATLDTIRELEVTGRFTRPIVTEIVPAAPFFRAEEYHQRYLEKRGLSHCHV
ncbi:MAG: peptide-methionine (S)-S-oxide reductase MsrA [Deltaproteobacteria bacterium]|nr:peptide-methionine (S)-S-oxide reductase MsrA [Deltaproteobacteria bacterium]